MAKQKSDKGATNAFDKSAKTLARSMSEGEKAAKARARLRKLKKKKKKTGQISGLDQLDKSRDIALSEAHEGVRRSVGLKGISESDKVSKELGKDEYDGLEEATRLAKKKLANMKKSKKKASK